MTNPLFNNQDIPSEDPSVWDHNPNSYSPLVDEAQPLVPSKAVSEESLLATYIDNEDVSIPGYEMVRDDYMQKGTSSVVNDIKRRAAADANKAVINQGVTDVAHGNRTSDEILQEWVNTPKVRPEDIQDLHQQALTAELFRNQATTAEEKIVGRQKISDLVEKGYPVEAAIQNTVNSLISTYDPSIVSVAAGLAADLLPFATTVSFAQAFTDAFGGSPETLELPRGELAVAFRKNLAELSPREQVQAVFDFTDSLTSNKNSLTATEFQKLTILQESLVDEFGTVDRVIGNIITALDAVAIGGVARSMFSLSKSVLKPGSSLQTINIANPAKAEKLAAEAIRKDLSEAVDMTPEELVEVLGQPSTWRQGVEMLPAEAVKHLEVNDQIAANLLNITESNPLILKPHEKEVLGQELRASLSQAGNSGLYRSNVAMRETEGGWEYTAKYGVRHTNGSVTPFASAQDALEAAALDAPDANAIRVFQRQSNSILVEVDPKQAGDTVGEFVYEVQGTRTNATVANKSDKLFYNDGDVVSAGLGVDVLLDSASRFSPWISGNFAQARDFGDAIAGEFQRIHKPFDDLGLFKKRKTIQLLDKYAKEWETMRTGDIWEASGRDSEVMRGFLAYRQAQDTLYHLNNRAFRKDLVGQGSKHLVDENYQGVGVPVSVSRARNDVDLAENGLLEVFDPKAGAIKTLDAAQVSQMYTSGSKLYRTLEPQGTLNKQSDLVIISDAAQVRELPVHVLKKREGHISRHYKENYYIRETAAGTKNGIRTTNFNIIRAVGDKAKANAVVKQLVRQGRLSPEQAKRAIVHDASLTPADRIAFERQDEVSLGRMFYHERAEKQLDGFDGLAEIADPIESLALSVQNTSRFVAHDDLISSQKQRWVNTFGRKLGLVDPRAGFPSSLDSLKGSGSTAGEVEAAKALWTKIRAAEGTMVWEAEDWRKMMFQLSDFITGSTPAGTIAGTLKSGIAALPKFLADNSPNRLLKNLAFTHLIALNPFRQAWLQSQQWMFLTALAPTQAPKIWAQGKAVLFGLMDEALPVPYKAGKNTAAKTMGMSVPEYEQFVKMFKETGLSRSLDSHDYVRGAMLDLSPSVAGNAVTATGRQLMQLARKPFRWVRAAGFDYGELTNLVNTFMIARTRYLKATGKKKITTQGEFKQVAADARNLALDMTSSGNFRYQEGAFSAFMQFFSVQHKAWLAVSPLKNKGNQAFTRQERLKLLTGQVVLNGAAGLGLYSLTKDALSELQMEMPEPVEDIIIGGLYETAINTALGLVDEDTELAVADEVSVLSGINAKLGDFFSVFFGHKSLVSAIPSSNVVNRYTDAIDLVRTMHDYPTLADDKSLVDMMGVFAQTTSGWSQYTKARAALRLGHHVTTHGSPTVQATYSSAIIDGLFGIDQKSLRDLYDLEDAVTDEYVDTSGGRLDREPREVANDLYNKVSRLVTFHLDEFDADIESVNSPQIVKLQRQKLRESLKLQMSILSVYDNIEQDRIWELFQRRANQELVTKTDGVIQKLVRAISYGDISGDPAINILNRLRESEFYKDGTQEAIELENNVKILMDSMTKKAAISQANEDTLRKLNGQN